MKVPDAFPVQIKRGNSTVKIYRADNKGRAEFTLAYYTFGQRKRETFADYGDARKRADAINDSIVNGDLASVTLSRDARVEYLRAKTALAELGEPLDLAALEYASARKELGKIPLREAIDFYLRRNPVKLVNRTVAEVYDEFCAARKQDGMSAAYLKSLRTYLRRFVNANHCQMIDVTNSDLNTYLRSLPGGGRNRNNHRLAIVTLFKFASSAGYLGKDHIDFDQVAKAKEPPVEIEIFTADEITALLKTSLIVPVRDKRVAHLITRNNASLLPLLALGAFAGLRTAEILRQEWSDINLERGFIRVTSAKGNTAQKRLVPIQDNLKQWLTLGKTDSRFCCEHVNYTDALHRLAERAKVKWKHNALRHSYISYRVAQTQNIPQTALEAGNSVAVVNRHYRELVTEGEAKAWFGITPNVAGNVIALNSNG